MSNQDCVSMKIELSNLTKAQAIAIEEMFAIWKDLSSVGSSRYVAFFADGDGNFHPTIAINDKLPTHKGNEVMGKDYFIEQTVTKTSAYWVDFGPITWKLYKE